MAYTLTLDPSAVATNRTALELNSGPIRVGATGGGGSGSVDWGDAVISAFMSDARWGSAPVDFRVPNRTVTVPLFLGADGSSFAAAKSSLTEKVALFQREGGWLRRGDTGWYADVVNATLTLPDKWGEAAGIEPDVKLVLECLPDFYGDEITLDAVTGTGELNAVLKASGVQARVSGDHPARCRILVSDTSGNNQDGVVWSLRSRHYDPAATAALVYEAEAMTPLDAAATFVHAGASGGSTMRHSSLPGGAWCPVMLTDLLAGAALTHKGSYRIRARVYSASAVPQLRLLWGVGDVAHAVTNAAVRVPGAGAFYLVDLGPVRLDAPPVGGYAWHGVIQALASTQGDPVEIDCLYLQPLDEYSGRLAAVQGVQSALGISVVGHAATGAEDASVGTVSWTATDGVDGDPTPAYTDIFAASAITHYLTATGCGFAIPAGATISGIQLDILRMNQAIGACVDNRVRLVKAGVVQAADKADTVTPWPTTSFVYRSYGGATDLWGGVWAPADINAAGFGAAIAVQRTAGATTVSEPAVNGARITVFYTTSGGFTVTADAVIFASRTAELRTEGMFRQDSTGTVEAPVASVIGDLPRLPPSGMEARAVELFLKPTRGDLAGLPDAGLDTFSGQVLYRPCFITSPS